jgi:hypothetical protein
MRQCPQAYGRPGGLPCSNLGDQPSDTPRARFDLLFSIEDSSTCLPPAVAGHGSSSRVFVGLASPMVAEYAKSIARRRPIALLMIRVSSILANAALQSNSHLAWMSGNNG